ncbi:MAG TPA: DUF3137 domain-containing protein [Candidatus Eisenbergiella merdipullorum]|uniref:DUF3137 domain-containing protein n=1 Tax=Candidatus Eisenbergiella merdipullorum TaxID=2838553 RepID=A0A9D2I777_9FIRM|nr:DUF3137 domain-containing protein [Candidatus Eisenbergiella merdipullorum]
MVFAEQNISGVKLEKLRQDAVRKTKIQKRLFPVCLIVFIGGAAIKNLLTFRLLSDYMGEGSVAAGVAATVVGDLIFAAMLAGVVYVFYMLLVWQKAYDRFSFSFKNRYVLDTIRQLPGFSELRYNAQSGFTLQELTALNLLPAGITYYHATDELRGCLDGKRFRACNVSAGRKAPGRQSLPDIVFEGQIIGFEAFDDRKRSTSYIQVMDRGLLKDMKQKTAPFPIRTENEAFNARFAVFAEEERNAFYILTPQVMERISDFADMAEGEIYLVFSQYELYVACRQARSPFQVYIDIPVEQQTQNIRKDTDLLRQARAILSEPPQGREEMLWKGSMRFCLP